MDSIKHFARKPQLRFGRKNFGISLLRILCNPDLLRISAGLLLFRKAQENATLKERAHMTDFLAYFWDLFVVLNFLCWYFCVLSFAIFQTLLSGKPWENATLNERAHMRDFLAYFRTVFLLLYFGIFISVSSYFVFLYFALFPTLLSRKPRENATSNTGAHMFEVFSTAYWNP